MRLSTLALACNKDFIYDCVKHSPVTLRAKWRYGNMDEAFPIATDLMLLIGHNSTHPITFDEIHNPKSRLASLFFNSDYSVIAAICIAFQGQGGVLRGCIHDLFKSPKSYREKALVRNKALLNPFVVEYLYRAVGQFSPDFKKQLTCKGPLDEYLKQRIIDGLPKDSVGCALAFAHLNAECGFSANDEEMYKAAAACPHFKAAWERSLVN